MPRKGVQPERVSALIDAAIAEIGEQGSMDVTVSQIARRAGVSPALAHHYLGSKNSIFNAAMRRILTTYGAEIRTALRDNPDHRSRLEAVIRASFSPENFKRETISAWLNFYVFAHKSDEVARLLAVYHRRLDSNLRHDLRPLVGDAAPRVAEGIAAMIDGAYVREGLRGHWAAAIPPEEMILAYLDTAIAQNGGTA